MQRKRRFDLGSYACCGLIFKASVRDFDRLLRVIESDFQEIFMVYQKMTAQRLWLKVGGERDD